MNRETASATGIITGSRKSRTAPPPDLEPPHGVRASRFTIDGEEHLVLSYPRGVPCAPPFLSPAQRAVAEAFVSGRSHGDIAKWRGTSKRTIANQIRAIYTKLGVGSRLELARLIRSLE